MAVEGRVMLGSSACLSASGNGRYGSWGHARPPCQSQLSKSAGVPGSWICRVQLSSRVEGLVSTPTIAGPPRSKSAETIEPPCDTCASASVASSTGPISRIVTVPNMEVPLKIVLDRIGSCQCHFGRAWIKRAGVEHDSVDRYRNTRCHRRVFQKTNRIGRQQCYVVTVLPDHLRSPCHNQSTRAFHVRSDCGRREPDTGIGRDVDTVDDGNLHRVRLLRFRFFRDFPASQRQNRRGDDRATAVSNRNPSSGAGLRIRSLFGIHWMFLRPVSHDGQVAMGNGRFSAIFCI